MNRLLSLLPFVAATLACAIALAVFSIDIIDPQNTAWLHGELLVSQFGWHQYQADPSHFYPLKTYRASYPLPLDLALFDNFPIIALALKPFVALLPEQFQYIGPMFVGAVALQTVIAWAVLREAVYGSGQAVHRGWLQHLPLFVGAMLFGTAPVLFQRFALTHASLTQQWLLLLSLLVYLRSFRISYRRSLRDFSLVTALAACFNPYLMMMTLIIFGGFIIKCLHDRSMQWTRYLYLLIPFYTALIGLFFVGFIDWRDLGAAQSEGFGLFSANFFAPIDPASNTLGSQFLPELPKGAQQYEGYGYLGLGAIFLIAASIVTLLIAGRTARVKWNGKVGPLLAVIVVSFCWAMSNRMQFGSHIIELPLPDKITSALQVFRSAGRFIWVTDYTLMLLAIAGLIRLLSPARACLILTVGGLMQIADLAHPLIRLHNDFTTRASAKSSPERFNDPAYRGLGQAHTMLAVLPPWQCRTWPAGKATYPFYYFTRISNLVMESNLRTNSFYTGRIPSAQFDYHCTFYPEQVILSKPADRRTAYLIAPAAFVRFGAHIAQTHRCDFAETMFLCRGDKAAGLSERAQKAIAHPPPPMQDAVVSPKN